MNREAILLHQVYPAKLAADLIASVVSNVLLWRHHLVPGLLIRYMLPLAGSAIVLSVVDVSAIRQGAAGRYVLAHMPPAAQAVRLAGDTVMAIGAWRRNRPLLLAGVLLVGAGWSHGLVPARTPERRSEA